MKATTVPMDRAGTTGSCGPPRLGPLALRASQTIRVQRLYPKAVYKEDLGQVVLPLPRGANAADHVRKFLAEVVPEEAAA